MCHGLAEARGDTVQADIDEVMVGHLGVDIECINIVQVFRHSTCLREIIDLVKSAVRVPVVIIVFLNGVCDFPSSIKPMLVRFPPFQCPSCCTQANAGQPLYLVAGLCDSEVIIHLKDASFLVLHVASKFGRGCCFSCYHVPLIA